MLSTRRRRAPADEPGAPPEHETRSLAAGRRHRPEGSGGGHTLVRRGFRRSGEVGDGKSFASHSWGDDRGVAEFVKVNRAREGAISGCRLVFIGLGHAGFDTFLRIDLLPRVQMPDREPRVTPLRRITFFVAGQGATDGYDRCRRRESGSDQRTAAGHRDQDEAVNRILEVSSWMMILGTARLIRVWGLRRLVSRWRRDGRTHDRCTDPLLARFPAHGRASRRAGRCSWDCS